MIAPKNERGRKTGEIRGSAGLHRLLVATDFSSRANRAKQRAILIADEHCSSISLLHVLGATVENGAQAQQQVRTLEDALRREMDKRSAGRTAALKIQMTTGTPFAEIIRQAREEAADVVLVGAHGANFIKDLLFGATAEKVVRHGDRPTLVVKRPARGPYQRVLVATDFSRESAEALKLAMKLAPRAKCYLLHAYQGIEEHLLKAGIVKSAILRHRRRFARESRKRMERFIRELNLERKPLRRISRFGRARHVITEAARSLQPDLLCLGSLGRTGIPYLLLGSVAEHVVRESKCDVLVVRSKMSKQPASPV